MKTTFHLPDSLVAEARQIAAREGTSVRALVEEGLRQVVSRRLDTPEFRLRDASVGGNGVQSGVDLRSWEQVRDLAYERHGA